MRRISFSHTERQLLDGSKTQTRRIGWRDLAPGQRLLAVRKCMGLRKGERQQVLGEIVVTDVRRERLSRVSRADVVAEGFPQWTPAVFVEFFCKAFGCRPGAEVTVIDFTLTRREVLPEEV